MTVRLVIGCQSILLIHGGLYHQVLVARIGVAIQVHIIGLVALALGLARVKLDGDLTFATRGHRLGWIFRNGNPGIAPHIGVAKRFVPGIGHRKGMRQVAVCGRYCSKIVCCFRVVGRSGIGI